MMMRYTPTPPAAVDRRRAQASGLLSPVFPLVSNRGRSGVIVNAMWDGSNNNNDVEYSQMLKKLQKYDFVSAGVGALIVTSLCVMRGQDPGTALWITAASTVVAVLVNDMMSECE